MSRSNNTKNLGIIAIIVSVFVAIAAIGYYVFWQSTANKIRQDLIDGKLKQIEESVLFKKIKHDEIEITGFPFSHTIRATNVDIEFDSNDISDILGLSERFTIDFKGNLASSKPVFGKGFSLHVDGDFDVTFNDGKLIAKNLSFDSEQKLNSGILDFIRDLSENDVLDTFRKIDDAGFNLSVDSLQTISKDGKNKADALKNTKFAIDFTRNNSDEVKIDYAISYDKLGLFDALTVFDSISFVTDKEKKFRKLFDDLEEKAGMSDLKGSIVVTVKTKDDKPINTIADLVFIEKLEFKDVESFKSNLMSYDNSSFEFRIVNNNMQNLSISVGAAYKSNVDKYVFEQFVKIVEILADDKDEVLTKGIIPLFKDRLSKTNQKIIFDFDTKFSVNVDTLLLASKMKDIQSGKSNPLMLLGYDLSKFNFMVNDKGIDLDYNNASKVAKLRINNVDEVIDFIIDFFFHVGKATGKDVGLNDEHVKHLIGQILKDVLFSAASEQNRDKKDLEFNVENIFTNDMKVNGKPVDSLMSTLVLKFAPIMKMINERKMNKN